MLPELPPAATWPTAAAAAAEAEAAFLFLRFFLRCDLCGNSIVSARALRIFLV